MTTVQFVVNTDCLLRAYAAGHSKMRIEPVGPMSRLNFETRSLLLVFRVIVYGNTHRHEMLGTTGSPRIFWLSQRETTDLTVRPIVSVFERTVLTDPDPRRSSTPSSGHFGLTYLVEYFWRDLFVHTATGSGREGRWSNRGCNRCMISSCGGPGTAYNQEVTYNPSPS